VPNIIQLPEIFPTFRGIAHVLVLKKTLASVLAGNVVCAVQAQTQGHEDAFKPGKNLAPFSSEVDLQAWFQPFVVERQHRDE